MREGCVDKVNEERRWKKGNPFIFWHSGGGQIRATREGIRSHEMESWNMNHGEIKVC